MTWTGPSSALQTRVWAAVAITAWLANTRPTLDGHVHRRTPAVHRAGTQNTPDPHCPPGQPRPTSSWNSHARGWGWGLRLMGHGRDSQPVPPEVFNSTA